MADEDAKAQQPRHEFPATRVSRAYWVLGAGLLVLLLVVIFIAQNSDKVDVHFLWLKWRNVALGITLFAGAILGALTALLLGAARIYQLRRQAKRAHQQ